MSQIKTSGIKNEFKILKTENNKTFYTRKQ